VLIGFDSDVARGRSVEGLWRVGARRIEEKKIRLCASSAVLLCAFHSVESASPKRGRVRISPEQFSAFAEGFGG
jgi:hypothetical protein